MFSHKNGLKFSKKVGIFPKMVVSPKKVFTFYARLLMQRSLEVCFGCMSIPPLIKRREAYWCISLS